MKIKSKKHFEVNYLFMKLFSQNFEVLTQHGDVINPKLARKRAQTCISCTNGDRKMKIKSKKSFEVRFHFRISLILLSLFPHKLCKTGLFLTQSWK